MSHYRTESGRPYVECDDPVRDMETGDLVRCGRRSFGCRDRFGLESEPLDIFALPRGWAVAPYSDGFDHGATRRSLLDGGPIPPFPWLVGISGDLHTCTGCDADRRKRSRVT